MRQLPSQVLLAIGMIALVPLQLAEAQPAGLNIGDIQSFLRKGLTSNVNVSASNTLAELKGRVHSVMFGSDPIPNKPPGFDNPCMMIVMLAKPGDAIWNEDGSLTPTTSFQGILIDFSNIEGVAGMGGTPGVVNPPFATKIYLNGKMMTNGRDQQPREIYSIEFTFQMKNMRDRSLRAMKDLQTWCSASDGGY